MFKNIGHSSSSRLKACRGGIAVVMRLTNVGAAPRAHGDTSQKRPGLYVCRGVAAWNRDRGLRRWFTPPTTSSTRPYSRSRPCVPLELLRTESVASMWGGGGGEGGIALDVDGGLLVDFSCLGGSAFTSRAFAVFSATIPPPPPPSPLSSLPYTSPF